MRRLGILAFVAISAVLAGALVAADRPAWAYPDNPPNLPPPVDDGMPKRVPGSSAAFTLKEVGNTFVVPVWHPDDHPLLPGIVGRGRPPGAMACGYCHYPTGAGKPENASLAGLPAEYIVQQLQDFKNSTRRSSVPKLLPQALMVTTAQHVTDEEVRVAAEYFSSLKLMPDWIKVVETEMVPEMTVNGYHWTPVPGSRRQPIGQRIFETADDKARTALRDYRSGFTAYVPVGSIKRGGSWRPRAETAGRCSVVSAMAQICGASAGCRASWGGHPRISCASCTISRRACGMVHGQL